MVKTKGPLLSADAHGSIADTLTFSHRKTGKQVRKYMRPGGIPSAKQRGQRRLTEFLVAHWQNMSDADKATWATKARNSGRNVAGYHYFLREAQRDLLAHHGLCLYLHMNEIVAGKVLDISGQGNDGTLGQYGGGTLPTLVKSRTLKFGNGLKFVADKGYVEATTKGFVIATGSYIFWIKPYTAWGTIAISYGVMREWGGLNNEIFVYYRAANKKIRFIYGLGSVYSAAMYWNANEWHMVAATFEQDNMRLYIDGLLNGTPDLSVNALTLKDEEIYIGATNNIGANPTDGVVDEVCRYNRVLSAGEIKTRYDLARRGPKGK